MRFVFVGQNIMGGCVLEALLATDRQPLLVITREPNDYLNRVLSHATAHGLPYMMTRQVNTEPGLLDLLRELQPDVIICCGWGNRIRAPLLQLPPRGWINLHPSCLPAYRGPSPIEWQIANGEEYVGGTAHFMAENIDTGNIIVQDRLPIWQSDNGETLRGRCGEMLGRLAVESLGIVDKDPGFIGSPQNEALASYFPRRPDDWQIDCHMPAQQVYDMVRSLSPFPRAVLWFRGQNVRVELVEVMQLRTRPDDIGKVTLSPTGDLLIAVADRWIKVVMQRV